MIKMGKLENFIFKEMTIHHIGYLVKKMDHAKELFIKLGYIIEKNEIHDSFRNVDICFLKKDGYRIELVSPRGKESVVGELRQKLGNMPYHICYEVKELEKTIEALKHDKYIIWEEAHSAVALEDRQVAFLVHGQVGMIELLEAAKE